jgi:PHP family Zn ribbon phosphoesterase
MSDDLCWNCDAAPNPAEERFEIDGVARTTWSCPKCSDRWTDGLNEQDHEIAAAKREAERLRRRVATLEGRLARVLRAEADTSDLTRWVIRGNGRLVAARRGLVWSGARGPRAGRGRE